MLPGGTPFRGRFRRCRSRLPRYARRPALLRSARTALAARPCPTGRRRLAQSCSGRIRVGEKQLLPLDLVVGDRLLAFGRDQPIDECLAELLLDVLVLL